MSAQVVFRDRIPLSAREVADRAAESCTQWNQRYPVGTAVRAYRLAGIEDTAFNTTTRGQAWVLGKTSAVVNVHGLSDALHLTHVRPLCGHACHAGGVSAGVLTLSQCLAAVVGDQLESGVVS